MRGFDIWFLAVTLAGCATPARRPGGSPGGAGASVASSGESVASPPPARPVSGTFGDDVAFLERHTDLVVLKNTEEGAQIVVAPRFQGRVMTSTARGSSGTSFGWIHRPVIERHAQQPHMTVVGGEDRFWVGPEGGQFGLYFPPGAPFEFEHWQVPSPIDWDAWVVRSRTDREVGFDETFHVANHSGTRFRLRVRRTIRLLDGGTVAEHLGGALGSRTHGVGYESDNVLTNAGTTAWKRETGLVSIWILGMFIPSEETVVAMPIRSGDPGTLGPAVRDDYFGSVSSDRLRVDGGVVYFKADGRARGKIGISSRRALPVAGSYDAARGVLTVVQFTAPPENAAYVDSRWARQADPYAGDVVNSYNDGPPEPGAAPLGPFYEIESSSPAVELGPEESVRHVHRTLHLQGPEVELDGIARRQLGVGIAQMRAAFGDGDASVSDPVQ